MNTLAVILLTRIVTSSSSVMFPYSSSRIRISNCTNHTQIQETKGGKEKKTRKESHEEEICSCREPWPVEIPPGQESPGSPARSNINGRRKRKKIPMKASVASPPRQRRSCHKQAERGVANLASCDVEDLLQLLQPRHHHRRRLSPSSPLQARSRVLWNTGESGGDHSRTKKRWGGLVWARNGPDMGPEASRPNRMLAHMRSKFTSKFDPVRAEHKHCTVFNKLYNVMAVVQCYSRVMWAPNWT